MGWGAHSIHITNKLKLASYSAMAANVFGNPVTDDTVRELYPTKTVITPLDRAKVAKELIENNSKKTNAKQFVESLISQYGEGIKTGGLFYNATGRPLTFISNHDYQGNVFKVSYPTVIQNGQWFAFLHVKGSRLDGSSAAVVYRSVNDQGDQYDYMCSWSVPDNKVHTYTITNCLNTHACVCTDTHNSFPLILLLEI